MNSGWYSTKHVEEKLLDKIKKKDKKIKDLERQNLNLEHDLAVQKRVNQKLLTLVNEQLPDRDLSDRDQIINT